MAKKTKRARPQQVSTNFKQNKPRRRASSGGGGAPRPGRTQGEFDPDQNVKQVAEPPMPAAPAAPTGDRFADAGLGAAPPSPFPEEAV